MDLQTEPDSLLLKFSFFWYATVYRLNLLVRKEFSSVCQVQILLADRDVAAITAITDNAMSKRQGPCI